MATMSISPYVVLLFAVCWMLPAMAIAVWYGIWYHRQEKAKENLVTLTHREIRAEILQIDYDAKAGDWRSENWEGPGADVRSQVDGRSYEVAIRTPYAETSVPVQRGNERELRRCSICLN